MSDYLMHEGVKGQKWGVRNGPPYPLSKGQHDKFYDFTTKKQARFKAMRRAGYTIDEIAKARGAKSDEKRDKLKALKRFGNAGYALAKKSADAINKAVRTEQENLRAKRVAKMRYNPKKYSIKELTERTKRLELEKRYKDLYEDVRGPSLIAKGKRAIVSGMSRSIGDITSEASSFLIRSKVNDLINKNNDFKELFGIKGVNIDINNWQTNRAPKPKTDDKKTDDKTDDKKKK